MNPVKFERRGAFAASSPFRSMCTLPLQACTSRLHAILVNKRLPGFGAQQGTCAHALELSKTLMLMLWYCFLCSLLFGVPQAQAFPNFNVFSIRPFTQTSAQHFLSPWVRTWVRTAAKRAICSVLCLWVALPPDSSCRSWELAGAAAVGVTGSVGHTAPAVGCSELFACRFMVRTWQELPDRQWEACSTAMSRSGRQMQTVVSCSSYCQYVQHEDVAKHDLVNSQG